VNVLLVSINSKYVHSNLANLTILANFESEAAIDHLEFSLKDHFLHIIKTITGYHPDVLAFSTYIWNIELILALSADLKKLLPQAKIVLGGPEADYNYKSVISNASVDFVFRGEGDCAFSVFIECLLRNRPLPGYIATDPGQDIHQAFTGNLNLLKSPYNKQNIDNYKNRLLYYETSRGCPFHCTYCLSSAMKGARYYSLENIKEDFSLFIRSGIKTVKLVDRTFNFPESRAISILDLVKTLHEEFNGNTIFHIEVVADIISDAFIETLRSLPKDLVQVEIGIQSIYEKTLISIQRSVDLKKLEKNIKKIIALHNVHVHLDLIAGLPYETLEDFIRSFNFVLGFEPHHFQLGFLKKLSGTLLPEQTEHQMVFSDKPPYEIYQSRYISFAELNFLKEVENILDRYYNSRKFTHIWKYLISTCYSDPFTFCKDFARYFAEAIPVESSFGLRNLFTYLYDFINYKRFVNKEFLINVLAFDYLLQEKPRYFPDWLPYKKDKDLCLFACKREAIVRGDIGREELRHYQENIHANYLNLLIARDNSEYILTHSKKPEPLLFSYPEGKTRLDINNVSHLEFLF